MEIGRHALRSLRQGCTSVALTHAKRLKRDLLPKFAPVPTIFPRYESIFASDSIRAVFKTAVKEREQIPSYPTAPEVPMAYRYMYPEFLPVRDWRYRNKIGERLERRDMMRRRAFIEVPEFYVGCIMRVTCSDPFAPSKINKFLGICIDRGGAGLRSYCVLRNIIEGHGIEIQYDLYNPTVRLIEVLKLERRVDGELYYLRDAPHHYSYVPQDFEAVPHPQGAQIPLNTTVVEMNPMPWTAKWYNCNYKALRWADGIVEDERLKEMKHFLEPQQWEKYDVMKQYRKLITVDEQELIYSEIHEHKKKGIEKSGNAAEAFAAHRKEQAQLAAPIPSQPPKPKTEPRKPAVLKRRR